MRDRRIERLELGAVYFGDQDLLRIEIDLRIAEGQITFSGAELRVAHREGEASSREELIKPVLVLTGLRSVATFPRRARPETIVLRWAFEVTPDGCSAEFMVIGDPEPVTMRFECEDMYLVV